jgi:hypothetical protein
MVRLSNSWKTWAFALLGLASQAGWCAPDVTDLEDRWIEAAWPVVIYARQNKLPLDIVVQPQDAYGHPPMAMAYVDGRCKLVLALRGNGAVKASLQGVPPALEKIAIETMAAHELGHCWRYVGGAWHTLPAGFTAADPETDDIELARLLRDMRDTRREEGFADLVGLAWIASRHPEAYAQIHSWLSCLRDDVPITGSHHDTRVWLRRTGNASVFDSGDEKTTLFEKALAVWRTGLVVAY